jgi:hypothetical protein
LRDSVQLTYRKKKAYLSTLRELQEEDGVKGA